MPALRAEDAAPPSPLGRWTPGQAWDWYKQQPWLVGFNFVPSTACNTTEWWQRETFDPETIDRELGWASKLGFNTTRAFVQYLVWKHDPDGLKERFGRFLALAEKHGISVVPVLFDDCSFGDPVVREPYLGRQRDPIPGMILPSWTPSPGLKAVTDRAAWADLERYVKDVVGPYGRDKRVLMWDLYNEPGNSGMGNRSLPLVEATFAWAREAKPLQPLTMGPWGAPAEISRRQLELSDIVSFHRYDNYAGLRDAIAQYKAHGRPVICTEWMARLQGSRWDTDLPLFRKEAVGCYSWGLVNGRTQCQFAWYHRKGTPEPKVWFHDLFRKDGTPYDPAEHEAIRKTAADKAIDWGAADYTKLLSPPGLPAHADGGIAYSAGWTRWTGEGPRGNALHYHNTVGGTAEFAFDGTGVTLIHKAGPDCGVAEIFLDGQPAVKGRGGALEADAGGKAFLDTYAADVTWNRRTPLAASLPRGKHTVVVVVTGRAHAASSNTYVQVVGFDVDP
jgi:hypothetical protein